MAVLSNMDKRGNLPSLLKTNSSDTKRYSGATEDKFDRKYVLFIEFLKQAEFKIDGPHVLWGKS